jgi:maltose phosphorylase
MQKIIYKPYIDAGVTNEDAELGRKILGTSWRKKIQMSFGKLLKRSKHHFQSNHFMQNTILTNVVKEEFPLL